MHLKNFDPYDFSKKEIGGVPVYYKNLPWAPCINIRIVFNTGAFDDPIGKEGLSHFLEHMIFAGSQKFPDKKSIREWSKIYALNSWNARTSFDSTVFELECFPEKYNTVLNDIKDIIFNSNIETRDVEHEKKIITQEAWNRFLNTKFLSYVRVLLKNVFCGHTHSRFFSALGWPDTINNISQEDIKSWYKNHYGIGNFFVILAGALEEKHIEEIKNFISNLPKVILGSRKTEILEKPKEKKFIKTADEIGEVKEQVEITFVRAFRSLTYVENETRSVSGKLLYDLLHERLREEHNLCYGVNVGSSVTKTFSEIFVSVKTDEKNIEIVEKEFWGILDEIKKGKHQNRFDLVKRVYLEQVQSEERLSCDIVDNSIAEIVKYNGRIITLKEQLEQIEKVIYRDVVEIVNNIFNPEYVYTEVILPSKK